MSDRDGKLSAFEFLPVCNWNRSIFFNISFSGSIDVCCSSNSSTKVK